MAIACAADDNCDGDGGCDATPVVANLQCRMCMHAHKRTRGRTCRPFTMHMCKSFCSPGAQSLLPPSIPPFHPSLRSSFQPSFRPCF
eukprot:365412-Chlamydomonas_euryale.AAC.2